MKKIVWIVIIVIILLLALVLLRSPEDDWIKDSRGVWVKHGAPSSIPKGVAEQQDAINCSLDLYMKAILSSIIQLNSQCLGNCGNYAVDIVHVPRTAEDNLKENQRTDFPDKVSHFIELDKTGDIVRIV